MGTELSPSRANTPWEIGARVAARSAAGALSFCGRDRTKALVLAIACGQVDTMRELLRESGYDGNRVVFYEHGKTEAFQSVMSLPTTASYFHLAHFCIAPRFLCAEPAPPPQLECLEVLVREFKAEVNERDSSDATPLHWLRHAPPEHRERALDVLASLGCNLDARGRLERTVLFEYARRGDLNMVQALLSRGASADAADELGSTPLIAACWDPLRPDGPALISALLRA
jgi:ankyrin repeat protein